VGFWDGYKGDRFKFVNPGDSIEGVVSRLNATDFGDGPVPVITIATDKGDQEVTCSQRVLQMRLAELAPEVGDWVKITYDGEDQARARPGRSPAKLFTVVVKRREGPAPAAETSAVPEAWGDEPF
jgi:uncharacterized protein YhfF